MPTSQDLLSIGIDVSKAKLDVALHFSDRSFALETFQNTPNGIQNLITFLQKHERAKDVPCVIEATGDYHLLVSVLLTRAGFTANTINPIITRKYQKSTIRNAKSDPIDAKRLAQIGLLEEELPVFSLSVEQIGKKKLVSLLAKLEKTRQSLINCFNQFQETSEELGLGIELPEMEEVISTLNNVIKVIKKQLASQASEHNFSEIPGVSAEQSAVLETMLSGKEFEKRDQLVAFTGFDVCERSSGTWNGKGKLSKRGNAYLRKVLYQIAWGLKMHNPTMKEFYEDLKKEKKHYTEILVRIARKFLRYIFKYYLKPAAS